MGMTTISMLSECETSDREDNTIVCDFEGALIHNKDPFAYFMVVAFEASGPLRFALLLLTWPIYFILYNLISVSMAIKLLIFVGLGGLKVTEIESVGRAVLPKFFIDNLRNDTWETFSAFGKKVAVTSMPNIMVEAFATKHLHADYVIGTQLDVNRFGRATGFVRVPGVLVGSHKRIAVKAAFGDETPNVGVGCESFSHRSFMSLCEESYVVERREVEKMDTSMVARPEPVVFHDGRLVPLPTPFMSLIIILWLPFGVLLAILRLLAGLVLPLPIINITTTLFGGILIVKGEAPTGEKRGVMFVCNHRTLLDPVILSIVLKRRIPAVTYSISRLSEILSPIPTVRLTRERQRDADMISDLLKTGDVAVCPEGTTCRERFLLRFSSMFAELSHEIVPVALECKTGFFYGTTARGLKAMDPIFFFMNPRPCYEITFLPKLPLELTCAGGKSRHEVANHIQQIIGDTLGFERTPFTRKDKYLALAGNDGSVPVSSTSSSSSPSWYRRAIREAFKDRRR